MCVCVRERERERVCVCVCVCVRERERERERSGSMLAATPFLGPTDILPTLIGMGSAAPMVRRPEIPARDKKVLKEAQPPPPLSFSLFLNHFTFFMKQLSKRFMAFIFSLT